jgi:hypothetical protein
MTVQEHKKVGFCEDCGKELSLPKYTRCAKCNLTLRNKAVRRPGKLNPMFGKKRPDLAQRNREVVRRGKDHPNYGNSLSIETRTKIGDANRGKLDGSSNPMFGKKRPDLAAWVTKHNTLPEQQAKIKEGREALWADPVRAALVRSKMSTSATLRCQRSEFVGTLKKGRSKPELSVLGGLSSLGLSPISQYKFNGFYIDIAFPDKRLLVEIDGVYWHSRPVTKSKDEFVNRLASRCGYRLLRFSDKEVIANLPAVIADIESTLRSNNT